MTNARRLNSMIQANTLTDQTEGVKDPDLVDSQPNLAQHAAQSLKSEVVDNQVESQPEIRL